MTQKRKRFGPKRILQQSITAEQGVGLINERLLEMGYLWYPTGGVEAGIDGHIELRDSGTGEVLNAIIRVQSKATKEPLGATKAPTCEYICEQRDIDYWMKGNAPVILVRSRPETKEAYWVSIKDYFADPKRRQSGKIIFDKGRDRFDVGAKKGLWALAIPEDQGVYFGPAPKKERLLSNMLPIRSFATHVYTAQTTYSDSKQLFAAAREKGTKLSGEIVVRNHTLFSFHDLSEDPWTLFCERGTVEPLPTVEWEQADDEQKQHDFVELLGRCLTERMRRMPIRRDKDRKCYYFLRTKNLTPRKFRYRSLKRSSAKTVFQGYPSRKDPKVIAYYRHTAFEGNFRRYDRKWYLEIVPTYFFTTDGTEPHPNYESKLKGIKAQERNNAVRNLVLMWASTLAGQSDALALDHDVIDFEDKLLEFGVNVGLVDEAWAPLDETEHVSYNELELFGEG